MSTPAIACAADECITAFRATGRRAYALGYRAGVAEERERNARLCDALHAIAVEHAFHGFGWLAQRIREGA